MILANLQGGTAGGIGFEAMMSLDDFDIEILTTQHPGRFPRQLHQQVDHQAAIGGNQQGNVMVILGQFVTLSLVQPRGRGDKRGLSHRTGLGNP